MTDTLFSGVVAAPADPIVGVNEKFKADLRSPKVNLSAGVYLTEEGKTPVLNVVKEAEEALAQAAIHHTYIPMSGLTGYDKDV